MGFDPKLLSNVTTLLSPYGILPVTFIVATAPLAVTVTPVPVKLIAVEFCTTITPLASTSM